MRRSRRLAEKERLFLVLFLTDWWGSIGNFFPRHEDIVHHPLLEDEASMTNLFVGMPDSED